jgi:hypothetical protein
MDWAALLTALVKLVAGVAAWRAERGAADAAEARIMSRALHGAMVEIECAKAARLAARDAARRDPAGVLRDDDGYRRD